MNLYKQILHVNLQNLAAREKILEAGELLVSISMFDVWSGYGFPQEVNTKETPTDKELLFVFCVEKWWINKPEFLLSTAEALTILRHIYKISHHHKAIHLY